MEPPIWNPENDARLVKLLNLIFVLYICVLYIILGVLDLFSGICKQNKITIPYQLKSVAYSGEGGGGCSPTTVHFLKCCRKPFCYNSYN